VPQGFYPGTDFESGYFMLSLNPEINEEQCNATVKSAKDDKGVNINGVVFHRSELESGGHGEAAKIRNYVAFTNNTCYELETGVKTKNDGLSREVDPDQVLKRLDPILISVKVTPEGQGVAKKFMQNGNPEAAVEVGK